LGSNFKDFGADKDVRIQNNHLKFNESRLPTPTHLFELRYEFSFIDVGQSFSQSVSGSFEFRKLRRLASSAPRWNIDAQCLATASDRGQVHPTQGNSQFAP
jgi:hypothetical protein